MSLMENHMFSIPYEGCDIVIRCDDAPHEPIYNTMTALSANSRYFRQILEGRTPIFSGYKFEEVTQDTDHYDTFSTNISQGMFFTLLDLWYNNNSVLDLVDYYGKDAIGIYVVLKRIESDKADLLRDAIVQFIRYDKPMANEFFHKSLRMQEYELFHYFRLELPAVFEELFLKYQSNVPVFSKRDLKRILLHYNVHPTSHYIPPGQRIQLPKPADFTKPSVGFNVKMLTSDGVYLYASSEMVEKAYFDGQWFWTRQNAHQIDEGKPMIYFETKYPSLIMKQVLHEVHSNAARELPLELIAYIYNVAFSLGFNLICGRMQTLLSSATNVNAQTVELAKFWGVDEIKEKLIRKMPGDDLLNLIGLKKGIYLFGLEEIGVRTTSRSSPYFSITEVRIILRDTFSKIVF